MNRRNSLITGAAVVGLASSLLLVNQSSHRAAPAPVTACGVERWSVKVGIDPAAKKVKTTPVDTTIAALQSLRAPVGPTTRVSPTEFTTYRIKANLVAYKMEADSDYHLALVDSQADSLIAEIPAPDCAGGSAFLKQITAARKTFDSKLTTTTTYQDITIPVVVTGIGFFDKIHGQRGVASNGIELHPVLSISFGKPTSTHACNPPSCTITHK